MAANPIVVVDQEGAIHIPEEYRHDPRFLVGARLELVPIQAASQSDEASRWAEFMKLRGLLANSDYDPNAELEAEKQRELAEEAGWHTS